MANAQIFCTVEELCADLDLPGGDVAALLKHIRAASQMIEMDIGEFIPATRTVTLNGLGKAILFTPALISITTIVNDDDTLTSADYILQPNNRHWQDGPYSWIIPDPDSATLSAFYDDEEGVVITGAWGKYSRYESTGTTLGSALTDTTGTSLAASNGARITPGAVLLIDSEQMLVTAYGSPTASVTTLNGALDASQEDVTLANGALVNTGEIIRVGLEQMKVLDKNGHTAYVRRGWNKTKMATHATSTAVDVYRTFTVERGANGTTAATHLVSTAINRYVAPEDVNYLCREIAGLLLKKAQGGFAGKSGSESAGTAYYNDEVPRDFFAKIQKRYRIPRL